MKNNKQKRTKRNIKKKGKGKGLFPRAKIQPTKETEEEKTIRLALEAISQANKELERQSAQDKIMDKMQNLQKRQKELRKSQLKLELDRRRTSKRSSTRGGKRKKGKKTLKI
jgi:hypothetical protein